MDACAALFEHVVAGWDDWAPADELTAEAIRPSFEAEEVYVAIRLWRIVGFASWYRPDNFLHSLFVRTPGRGVGSALLAHVGGLVETPLTLKCSEHNVAALAFYDRKGWTEIERGVTGSLAWRRLQAPG